MAYKLTAIVVRGIVALVVTSPFYLLQRKHRTFKDWWKAIGRIVFLAVWIASVIHLFAP